MLIVQHMLDVLLERFWLPKLFQLFPRRNSEKLWSVHQVFDLCRVKSEFFVPHWSPKNTSKIVYSLQNTALLFACSRLRPTSCQATPRCHCATFYKPLCNILQMQRKHLHVCMNLKLLAVLCLVEEWINNERLSHKPSIQIL